MIQFIVLENASVTPMTRTCPLKLAAHDWTMVKATLSNIAKSHSPMMAGLEGGRKTTLRAVQFWCHEWIVAKIFRQKWNGRFTLEGPRIRAVAAAAGSNTVVIVLHS